MRFIFALLGMAFLLSVGTLALGAIASLMAIFFGYPVGWGIATAILCFAFASSGWRGLTNLGIGSQGIQNNADGAFGLLHISALFMILLFSTSEMPHQISAWWALLLPFVFIILSLAAQWLFKLVLDVVNPSGKRM